MMKKLPRILLAVLALVAGVASLAIPVVPGWLLIGVGLVLLFPDAPFFDRVLRSLGYHFPSVRAPLEKLRRWMHD